MKPPPTAVNPHSLNESWQSCRNCPNHAPQTHGKACLLRLNLSLCIGGGYSSFWIYTKPILSRAQENVYLDLIILADIFTSVFKPFLQLENGIVPHWSSPMRVNGRYSYPYARFSLFLNACPRMA